MATTKITSGVLGSSSITSDAIGDLNVDTADIADSAITYNKLNANTAHTDRVQTFSVAQRGKIKDLGVRSVAAGNQTVTLVMGDSNHYRLVANANLTVANPTGLANGQSGSITFNANGSYTTSWGSWWRFATGVAPTMSTVAGKQDRVDYYVYSSNTIHAVATIDLLGTA